jgi:hypothetical protein
VNASDERRTVQTRAATLAAVLAVLLLAVAAVASGCGSASSDDGVAALDDESKTTSEDDGSKNAAAEDPQDTALQWAKCMREHGVDVPDPEVEGGRFTVRAGGPGRRLDRVDGKKFQAAQKACGTPFGKSGPPPLSDEERAKLQETMLSFAKCMREHGVDMPDPQFSDTGGGMIFRAGPGPGQGSVNPDSSKFREAEKACGEILENALPDRPGAQGRTSSGDAE